MSIWQKLDQVETAKTEYTIIPEGLYKATVTDIEVKEDIFQTSISVEFTITGDEQKGRKCWWSSRMSEESSPKALSFIKGQICRLAKVESTNGDPLNILTGCNSNECEIEIKHSPGIKDPSKTYLNVYIK